MASVQVVEAILDRLYEPTHVVEGGSGFSTIALLLHGHYVTSVEPHSSWQARIVREVAELVRADATVEPRWVMVRDFSHRTAYEQWYSHGYPPNESMLFWDFGDPLARVSRLADAIEFAGTPPFIICDDANRPEHRSIGFIISGDYECRSLREETLDEYGRYASLWTRK